MSRRSERIEEARKRRRNRGLLIAGAVTLALVAVVAIALLTGPVIVPPLIAADLTRISPEETYELMQTGELVLYDVRSQEAYATLHAEGSVSLPESEALARIAELPSDQLLAFI